MRIYLYISFFRRKSIINVENSTQKSAAPIQNYLQLNQNISGVTQSLLEYSKWLLIKKLRTWNQESLILSKENFIPSKALVFLFFQITKSNQRNMLHKFLITLDSFPHSEFLPNIATYDPTQTQKAKNKRLEMMSVWIQKEDVVTRLHILLTQIIPIYQDFTSHNKLVQCKAAFSHNLPCKKK